MLQGTGDQQPLFVVHTNVWLTWQKEQVEMARGFIALLRAACQPAISWEKFLQYKHAGIPPRWGDLNFY